MNTLACTYSPHGTPQAECHKRGFHGNASTAVLIQHLEADDAISRGTSDAGNVKAPIPKVKISLFRTINLDKDDVWAARQGKDIHTILTQKQVTASRDAVIDHVVELQVCI